MHQGISPVLLNADNVVSMACVTLESARKLPGICYFRSMLAMVMMERYYAVRRHVGIRSTYIRD